MKKVEEVFGGCGRWLLAATFLVTPMVTLRPSGSETFGDIFLLLAVCFAGLMILVRRRLPDVPVWIWGGGGLLLVSIALTVIWPPASVQPLVDTYLPTPYTSTFSTGVRLLLALVVLPISAGILADRGSAISIAAWAWLAGAAISCGVAVLDGVFGTGIQVALANDPDEVRKLLFMEPPRFVGLGVHPTSFSVTAAMAMPLVLARMTSSRKVLQLSPILLVLSLGIVLSASRVGYIGAFVVVILTILFSSDFRQTLSRPDPRTWIPLILIVAISAGFFVNGPLAGRPEPPYLPAGDVGQTSSAELQAHPQIDPEFTREPTDRLNPADVASSESNETRIRYFKKSVQFFVDRPLGGYGYQWIESAHDIYLQLLVSGGLLALAGFLWVYLGYIRRGFELRRRLTGEMEVVRIAVTVSLCSYLVMGLVQTDLLDRYLYLPAGLILALSGLIISGKSGSDRSKDVPE